MFGLGLGRLGNGVCHVQIRKDIYPYCITHEVMHGFSGEWHGGEESTMFCEIVD